MHTFNILLRLTIQTKRVGNNWRTEVDWPGYSEEVVDWGMMKSTGTNTTHWSRYSLRGMCLGDSIQQSSQ